MPPRPTLSVIVPFHRNLDQITRCLAALVPLHPGDEIIVAADGAVDDCRDVAARFGARVIDLPGPNGPAVARNRGAEHAAGEVLVFVDADVVAAANVLEGFASFFAAHPDADAVFGAYDESPGASDFLSQYKNLAHSYVHRTANRVAQTFWAGLGAIRADAFFMVGGFDERFRRPCIEDIDLGYRLNAAGYRVMVDSSLRGCHLKRWTFRSLVATDIFQRGIPWTQLILRFDQFGNDLNINREGRAGVVLAYSFLALAALSPVMPILLVPAAGVLALLVTMSRKFYGYFVRRRGWWFAARVVPVQLLYHVYNGMSFGIGVALFMLNRAGMPLRGALPLTAWSGSLSRARGVPPEPIPERRRLTAEKLSA